MFYLNILLIYITLHKITSVACFAAIMQLDDGDDDDDDDDDDGDENNIKKSHNHNHNHNH